MSGISRYLVRQIALPLAFFTVTLSGVIWLTQSLRMLDVIITKGQTVSTFLIFSALVFPTVLTLVLPVGFFSAVLYGLHRMRGDHELVVLSAMGQGPWGIIRPVLAVAACVTISVLVLNLTLVPSALSELRERIVQVRADFAATLLREGAFSTPMPGLTVYIRGRDAGDKMLGILVHDNRDLTSPVTYMAEQGAVVKSAVGPRLVMVNGNVQRRAADSGRLTLLYFDRYTFDLSEFLPGTGNTWKEPEERYLSELFFPGDNPGDLSRLDELRAEGHRRLSSPLYVPAFAMIGLVAMLGGQFSRRAHFWRLGIALAVAVATRLTGLGLESLSAESPVILPATYACPIIMFAAGAYLFTEHGRQTWRKCLKTLLRTPDALEPHGG